MKPSIHNWVFPNFFFTELSKFRDKKYYIYCPQTKFAKVMFSQVSVCLSTGGCLPLVLGGVCHPQADTLLSRHPLGRDPQTDSPLGRHPPCRLLWADIPRADNLAASACWDTHPPLPSAFWDTSPCPVHDGIHTPCPVHAGIHPSPAQCMLGYSQQAGGMHPTGMHSCLKR